MEARDLFINRELSWLDFNARVLRLAHAKHVPLGERLKFAAIYASNLDEFFMVRVGALHDKTLLKASQPDELTGMSPAGQISAIMQRVGELQAKCDSNLKTLEAKLADKGYRKVDFEHLTPREEKRWKKFFLGEVSPVLSPQILDARHPFPFLRGKGIYFCMRLAAKQGEGGYGLIPMPEAVRRIHFRQDGMGVSYALTEEMLYHFGPLVFDKKSEGAKCLFRVTRNADITADEGMMDHDVDFREVMSELLKKRRKLAAVRLQFWPSQNKELANFLCAKLVLPAERCSVQSSPLDLSWCFQLAGQIQADGRTELLYPAASPLQPPADYDLHLAALQGDVLLCYPYQSIRPFVKMLTKAAFDPSVISIKTTLYRVATDSQIVQALIAAAENGKEVVTIVELRARFDEQNNIDWSKQLEKAGCTVIYGFEDYKVHSKLTVITAQRGGKTTYLTQIGTGNYNEKTSELYTDLSFVTTRQDIGEEAAATFNNLSLRRLTDDTSTLLVAPLRFKSVILREMDAEIAEARAGRPAGMELKCNSINDRELMEKIAEASAAGVRVDMVVRGICCLRTGVPGYTENMHIRSLVGRYLEHSRVYCFGSGERLRAYLASGDFLTRNTERRVEVGVRMEDRALAERLQGLVRLELQDNVNASVMQPDGSYAPVKAKAGEAQCDSQMMLYQYFADSWGSLPQGERTPGKKRGLWGRLMGLFGER